MLVCVVKTGWGDKVGGCDRYKARSYRARSVRDPRAVLKEFGLELPSDTIIQVLDSNADSR